MIKQEFHYECISCGMQYDDSLHRYTCDNCSTTDSAYLPPHGILKTIYNYDDLILAGISFSQLQHNHFLDLLPISSIESLPDLHIGHTPIYRINQINNSKFPFNLFVKDDSQNPTYSFKDRASAIVSAYAKEKGYGTIVTASTGNAGSSLAGICASQQQKAVIIVPESAPIAKLTQIIMYGATIIPVKGTYDDAFDLSIQTTNKFGWYNRNTAYNPLTIEGKKSVAFELYRQMNFSIPDRIFVPVGDGVIISGVYKGFEDLLKLQIIDRLPTIVAVQSSKSDNLIRNIGNADFVIEKSSTIADSISVDIPRNFYMTQKYIQNYEGEYISVSDSEILHASELLASNTGLFAEPAAAAAFAGLLSYTDSNKIPDNSNNIILLTGSGLKDISAVSENLKIPDPVIPTIDNLKKLLQ